MSFYAQITVAPTTAPRLLINDQSTDNALILACQQGDHRAFDLLMRRHDRTLHGILRRLAPDWAHLHDDLVQECMIRIYKGIKSLRNPSAFKSWMNQMATNLFYDELRKKPKMVITSIDDHYLSDDSRDSAPLEISDTTNQPEDVMHRKQIVAEVNAAIARLPEAYRNVIVLRELHGLAYDEIARITDSELGTVKSRLARGRAKMQVTLESLRCA